MRILLIAFSFILLSSTAHSKVSVLKCLGQEELEIHKRKIHGPLEKLNKRLVNAVASLGELHIKRKYQKKICKHPNLSTSVSFLAHVLQYGREVFLVNPKSLDRFQQVKLIFLDQIVQDAPGYFFQYLSEVQSMVKDPNCLESRIPGLSTVLFRFRHLQENQSPRELLQEGGFSFQVFKDLKKLGSIFKDCSK